MTMPTNTTQTHNIKRKSKPITTQASKLERPVLDHGYVRLRNVAGPTPRYHDDLFPFDARDKDVPQTARKSFNSMGRNYTYEEEMKLADYLYRNFHTTPFEMIESWWDLKLPIFADRQWVRHRTWGRDEASARYTVLSSDCYIPNIRDVMLKTADKKQGGRLVGLDNATELELAKDFVDALREQCRQSYLLYGHYLKGGIAPEQARMFLHLNHYVEWTGKVDLHNLLHFLTLRTHDHAQFEIRCYAWAMVELLTQHLPGLMELWQSYKTQRHRTLSK